MNIPKTMLALFAGALLLSSISGSAVAAASTWYLGAEDTLYADEVLPPADIVTIFDGQSSIFFAVDPAAITIDFGTGNFLWSLETSAAFNGNFRVLVGYGDGNELTAGGFFTSSVVTTTVSSGQTLFTGTIPVTDFMVPAGSYLGFAIDNIADPSTTSSRMKVLVGDADSSFTTTSTDPGYPTPELGTILLTTAGLGVVGMVVARRRA